MCSFWEPHANFGETKSGSRDTSQDWDSFKKRPEALHRFPFDFCLCNCDTWQRLDDEVCGWMFGHSAAGPAQAVRPVPEPTALPGSHLPDGPHPSLPALRFDRRRRRVLPASGRPAAVEARDGVGHSSRDSAFLPHESPGIIARVNSLFRFFRAGCRHFPF